MNQNRSDVRAAFLSFIIFPLWFLSCQGTTSQSPAPAADKSTPKVAKPSLPFSEENAFAHVKKQVGFGPRPAGSSELAKTREYIVSQLKSYGLKVTEDSFSSKTPLGEKRFVNIVASIAGERSDVIILASHYDTKLTKDYKFVGANDGASSTAVLIELARLLAQQKRHKFTLWFAFFDGEEAFCQHWDECSTPESPDNTYGSRRMVANLIDENSLKKIRALILMDMVGYRNLELGRDSLSSSWLVNTIWNTARDLGYEKYFLDRVEGVGGDDHVPFLKAGIDSIDIIQLNSYPYWHTPEDTLDKISSKSLKIVGDTVLASLPHIEEHLIKSETKK